MTITTTAPPVASQGYALGVQWSRLVSHADDDRGLSIGGQSLVELAKLELFEKWLLQQEQTELPVFHKFSDGVYIREMHAPRGAVVLGHLHRDECMNMMLKGKVLTIVNGKVEEFTAGFIGKSGAHTRKASIVIEDMIWATAHANPTNETDVEKLEEMFVIKDRLSGFWNKLEVIEE